MRIFNVGSALAAILLLLQPANAAGENVSINPPEEGSISTAQGLDAWDRIYDVTSHPRCSNCHVGADNRPIWSGPSYGRTRVHGMNINAGESRIGAEYIQCNTCHALRETAQPSDLPHAPPQVAMDWQLASVEAEWFGKSSAEICAQLSDPNRNGGRTYLDITSHLDHDLILHWAWSPGSGVDLILLKNSSLIEARRSRHELLI